MQDRVRLAVEKELEGQIRVMTVDVTVTVTVVHNTQKQVQCDCPQHRERACLLTSLAPSGPPSPPLTIKAPAPPRLINK